jgi:hypothetical protein
LNVLVYSKKKKNVCILYRMSCSRHVQQVAERFVQSSEFQQEKAKFTDAVRQHCLRSGKTYGGKKYGGMDSRLESLLQNLGLGLGAAAAMYFAQQGISHQEAQSCSIMGEIFMRAIGTPDVCDVSRSAIIAYRAAYVSAAGAALRSGQGAVGDAFNYYFRRGEDDNRGGKRKSKRRVRKSKKTRKGRKDKKGRKSRRKH